MVVAAQACHLLRCQILNKPLSFSTRTCLTSLAFMVAGSQTCGSFSRF